MKRILPKIKIMSLNFKNKSKAEYLQDIKSRLNNNRKTAIFTPNPQILLSVTKNKKLLKVFKSADILVPDGTGILLAAKLKGTPLKERVAGIELAEDILRFAQNKKLSVFLLGGKPHVAALAANRLRCSMPNINICGCHHGYFDKRGYENNTVLKKIKAANPDILFVCFGSPIQEEWIYNNFHSRDLHSIRLAIGLGGSLDVWSGKLHRAPKIFRKLSCEWLWRVLLEPKRVGIFVDIPRFLYRAVKEQ